MQTSHIARQIDSDRRNLYTKQVQSVFHPPSIVAIPCNTVNTDGLSTEDKQLTSLKEAAAGYTLNAW